jgi:DNA-binding LacI/PurR family transcriptional regulator
VKPRGYKKAAAVALVDNLEALCGETGAGNRLPALVELMERFDASQHSVTRALEQLERAGRIVRRHGAGTFVTNGPVRTAAAPRTASRTVVAIERPDASVYDRCVEMLCRQSFAAGLDLGYRFVQGDRDDMLDPDSLGHPLGVIVFHASLAPMARTLRDRGHRVVLIGAPQRGEIFGVPNVFGNQEYGGYLIAKHLIELGHRRLAISGNVSELTSMMRGRGYAKAIREADEAGVRVAYEFFSEAKMIEWANDPVCLRESFRGSEAPTAVIAWNDNHAAQLVTMLTRVGISVPDEVSVTGFDNLPLGMGLPPHLTTVETMLDSQVAAALDLLLAPTPAPDTFQSVYAPALVARQSTASPRRDS